MQRRTHEPESVGPRIGAQLQKELGVAEPIPWTVMGESRRGTAHDALVKMFGGKLGSSAGQYQLSFDLPDHPAVLLVGVVFVGTRDFVPGSLTYLYEMAPEVPGSVMMERPPGWGAMLFNHNRKIRHIRMDAPGMEDWAALHVDEDWLVRLVNMLRPKIKYGGNVVLRIPSQARVMPGNPGSVFWVMTLMQNRKMGFVSRYGARTFLDLAEELERAIPGVAAAAA